jgi:hypothetical protein
MRADALLVDMSLVFALPWHVKSPLPAHVQRNQQPGHRNESFSSDFGFWQISRDSRRALVSPSKWDTGLLGFRLGRGCGGGHGSGQNAESAVANLGSVDPAHLLNAYSQFAHSAPDQ